MADEVVIATLDVQPLRARFPLHVEIFGVAAVVIPEAEYAELKAKASGGGPRRKPKSPIDNDREVAEFLAASRSTLFGAEALAECERRFGADRTPSRSALDRFWHRLDASTTERKTAPANAADHPRNSA